MKKLIFLVFLMTATFVRAEEQICAKSLIDEGYMSDVNGNDSPLDLAVNICHYYNSSQISRAKALVDEKFVQRKKTDATTLNTAVDIAYYNSESTVNCAKAIEGTDVLENFRNDKEYSFLNNLQLCYYYKTVTLNCAADLVRSGIIQDFKGHQTRFMKALDLCYYESSQFLKAQHSGPLTNFFGAGANGSKAVLPVDEVNKKIQLPTNSQILMGTELEVPGNEVCAAPTSGNRSVKCWVCRSKPSNNDVLYAFPKDQSGNVIPMRTLPVENVMLSNDRKEISFNLARDPSDMAALSQVRCVSKKAITIESRNDLAPILEANGLKLSKPAAEVR